MEKQVMSAKLTFILLLSAILPLLDSSLVNVLLPVVAESYASTPAQTQWGISGYMLAATGGIILSTTMMRRYGSGTVWYVAVIVFGAASVGVGAAPSLVLFVAARAIQGLACGFIMPSVQAIVAAVVGKNNIRAVLATIGLPAVIAPAFGPLLGGLFVEIVGWRMLFFINIPIVIAAVIGARGTIPRSSSSPVPIGLGQAFPALLGGLGVIYVVSQVGQISASNALLWGVITVAAVSYFCWADLRSEYPLLGMSLYKNPNFALTMVVTLIVGAGFYGGLLATSLHVQGDFHQRAWVAGAFLAFQGAGSWWTRNQVKGRWKEYGAFGLIASGLLLTALSTWLIGAVITWSATTALALAILSLLRGLGLGACTLLALSAAYEVLPEDQALAAGAHSRLMLQYGGVVGTTVVGVWQGTSLALGLAIALVCAVGAFASVVLRRRLQ